MGRRFSTLSVKHAIWLLKEKIRSAPVLIFLDFDKPFLLETDASGEGLGAMFSQKQDDGCYHPVAFGSRALTPSEQNYHSSKLEFLALKWSITKHFKEYLEYTPFIVWTDNNPLTDVMTMPNLDVTGHHWVGTLALYDFTLEYQKGSENGASDALSRVPICQNHETAWSLLEGATTGTADGARLSQAHPYDWSVNVSLKKQEHALSG